MGAESSSEAAGEQSQIDKAIPESLISGLDRLASAEFGRSAVSHRFGRLVKRCELPRCGAGANGQLQRPSSDSGNSSGPLCIPARRRRGVESRSMSASISRAGDADGFRRHSYLDGRRSVHNPPRVRRIFPWRRIAASVRGGGGFFVRADRSLLFGRASRGRRRVG